MKMVSRNHQVIKKGAAAVGVLRFTHLIRARIFLASPVRWLDNMCELILNLLNLLYRKHSLEMPTFGDFQF